MPSVTNLGSKIKLYFNKLLDLREDINPTRPVVLESILPTFSMDWLLGHYLQDSITVSCAATGNLQVFAAESTHRYEIYAMELTRLTGTFTFTQVLIHDSSRVASLIWDAFSSATAKYYPTDAGGAFMRLTLEPNDKIYIYVDAHTTTGNFKCSVWAKVWKTNKERDPWREL